MSRPLKTTEEAAAALPRELEGAQMKRLIEAAGDLTLMLDGEGLVLEVFAHDPELLKAVRRDWRGKPFEDIVTIESRDKVRALLEGALDGRVNAPRQVNHPSQGGPDLPVLYSALRIAGGPRSRSATRLLAIGRDLRDTVTLQRRLVDTQQTMERDYWRFREAETRYRNLFQSSSEAVLIVEGANLRVLEANPAALALLEPAATRASKVLGATLSSLFAPEAAEALAAAFAGARSVGRHERLSASLAGSRLAVTVSVSSFRQDQAAFLLVRLAPEAPPRGAERGDRVESARADSGTRGRMNGSTYAADRTQAQAAAFVRGAADAVAFTDAAGRVLSVNRSFVRLAELSSEDQARGESLDRWLGRTGVELSVLLTNLRERGSVGLFVTELRGALGLVTEVEISASALDAEEGDARFAFALRDVGRRLTPNEQTLPTKVPASVQQLTELVGRVPLRQIVAETSDLIERLSIETALEMTRDNRANAAQLLGLSRQSLYVKLRRFGMGGLEGPDEG